MTRYIAVLLLLIFPGVVVAGKPEIIQLSPDTYMITKADHGGNFWRRFAKAESRCD